jgi:hypothetical protein
MKDYTSHSLLGYQDFIPLATSDDHPPLQTAYAYEPIRFEETRRSDHKTDHSAQKKPPLILIDPPKHHGSEISESGISDFESGDWNARYQEIIANFKAKKMVFSSVSQVSLCS